MSDNIKTPNEPNFAEVRSSVLPVSLDTLPPSSKLSHDR